MCVAALPAVLAVASTAVSAYGAYNQAKSQKSALEYNAALSERNAKISEWQAQDVEARGKKEQQRARMANAQQRGSQRASLAARGLDLNGGSALSILDDTEYFGQLDQNTIGDNAEKEAWAIRNKGYDYTALSRMQRSSADGISPGMSLTSTFLTSASGVADKWSEYKKRTA